MSGLADNFLPDLLLRQPFLGPEREDNDNELTATVAVALELAGELFEERGLHKELLEPIQDR